MPFKFEKLEVWKEAVDLSTIVHDVCKKFPKDELYILTPQMKRETDSISLNIAEGSTGQSNAEFKKFLGYSIPSSIELIGCIHLAQGRLIISTADFDLIYAKTDNLVKRVQALRNSLNI